MRPELLKPDFSGALGGRPAARRLGASTDSAGALGELSREVRREHLLAQKPRGLRR